MQPPTITHRVCPPAAPVESQLALSTLGGPTERFRVALIGVGSAGGPIDLAQQLRIRLRFIAAAIAMSVGLALLLRLWLNAGVFLSGGPERAQQVTSAANHLGLTLAMLCALVLLRQRGFTIRSARRAEALVFGATALFTTYHQVGVLRLEREYIALHPLTHSMAAALPWALIVVAYGVLVPNTWRRCAAALGLIVALVLLGTGLGFLLAPQTVQVVGLFVLQKVIWIGTAVSIVVYGAYRIEALRDQAELGRELGQYRLGRRLGAGGMGEVYLAEHVLLRRPCAIKIIRPERAGDPKQLLRFEREVRATATLSHPNTIQVFDYGHASDGTFYYVMEFLPGLTLEQLVQAHGTLPPGRAVHFLRQVCAALSEAHAVGLIHRDIKPGNVMVCERGGRPDSVKLLDFGLVLPVGGGGDNGLTQEGAITGTPAYMAPEQAGGQQELDARCDIYSIGALAYYLLSGAPPFGNRTVVKMLAAHLYERPLPLAGSGSGVPSDLDAVVLRCLAKSPEDRFPSVAALDSALAACQKLSLWTPEDGGTWWQAHAISAGALTAPHETTLTPAPGAASDRV